MKVKKQVRFVDEFRNYIEFVPDKKCPGFTHRVIYNGTATRNWLGSDFKVGVKSATFFLEKFRRDMMTGYQEIKP
jgi:hypothetical protein